MKKFGTIVGIIFILSGCGSLSRGISRDNYYRGTDTDLFIINEPIFWFGTLGIYPIFSIISLPIDVVVDTALLPVDHVVKIRKDNARTEVSTKEDKQEQEKETQTISDNQQQSTLTPSHSTPSVSPVQGGWLIKPDKTTE